MNNQQEKVRRDCFVFAGKAEQGYSGSPIFAERKLCGLLFDGDSQGEAFAIKAKYISAFLAYVKENKK